MKTGQKCIPNSKLFAHKVLLSLHFLHGIHAHRRGATVNDIENYIKSKFLVDGDIRNQLQTSLMECVRNGVVYKNGNKYLLIGPVAGLQKTPRDKWTVQEVKRVKKIFSYKWTNEKDIARKDNSGVGILQRIKEAFCGMCCDKKTVPRKEIHDEGRNECLCKEAVMIRDDVPSETNTSEGTRNTSPGKSNKRRKSKRKGGQRRECFCKKMSEVARNASQNKGKQRKKPAAKSIRKRNKEDRLTRRNSRTSEKYYKNRKCYKST